MIRMVQGDAGRPEDMDFQEGVHIVSFHSPFFFLTHLAWNLVRDGLVFSLQRDPLLEKGQIGELQRSQLVVTRAGN